MKQLTLPDVDISMHELDPLQPSRPSPELRTLSTYDRVAQHLATLYESADRSRMQQAMARHFGRGYEVLELGCGSGADAPRCFGAA